MRKYKIAAALFVFMLTLHTAAPVFAGVVPFVPSFQFYREYLQQEYNSESDVNNVTGSVESAYPSDEPYPTAYPYSSPPLTYDDSYDSPTSGDSLYDISSPGGDSNDDYDYDDTLDDEPFIYSDPPLYDYDDPPRDHDWSSDMVSSISISNREEGLDMSGDIPEISEDFGGAAGDLNEEIDDAVTRRIRLAKDVRAKEIYFEYEIYSDSEMVSVIICSTVTSATSKTEYDSVNFDPSDGSDMDLTDAIGFDIVPLAEKILNERIRRDPERYNASFDTSGIDENPFYWEDGSVYILFDDFQLASSAADGINKLRLDLDSVRQVDVDREDYRINRDYNLRMVPLKQICSGLGYDVDWVEDESRVDIYLDGELISDLEPGVNDYEEHGLRSRTLEAAPELHYDTVYVPISFFDQILSWITYTVDEEDNITFYSYEE